MSRGPRRAAASAVLLVLVGLGIARLADATVSRDTPVDERLDLSVVVRATTVDEPAQAVDELTAALVAVCRTDVGAELAGFSRLDADEFRFVLSPTLDESDRDQLHGCLEDARVQHLQLDVLAMRTVRSARDSEGRDPKAPNVSVS